MLLLAILVTLIPVSNTNASTLTKLDMPTIVYARIGETLDLSTYAKDAREFKITSISNKACSKKTDTIIMGNFNGITTVSYTYKVNSLKYTDSVRVRVLPKDTSKMKFTADGYVLIKDVKIEGGKYRGAIYTVTYYNGTKRVATRGVKVKYSGINDSWIRVNSYNDAFTTVKLTAKYTSKKSLSDNYVAEALKDNVSVSSGSYIKSDVAGNLKIKYTRNSSRSHLCEPTVGYTAWITDSQGNVLLTYASKFDIKPNTNSQEIQRKFRFSNKKNIELPSSPIFYASVRFVDSKYIE